MQHDQTIVDASIRTRSLLEKCCVLCLIIIIVLNLAFCVRKHGKEFERGKNSVSHRLIKGVKNPRTAEYLYFKKLRQLNHQKLPTFKLLNMEQNLPNFIESNTEYGRQRSARLFAATDHEALFHIKRQTLHELAKNALKGQLKQTGWTPKRFISERLKALCLGSIDTSMKDGQTGVSKNCLDMQHGSMKIYSASIWNPDKFENLYSVNKLFLEGHANNVTESDDCMLNRSFPSSSSRYSFRNGNRLPLEGYSLFSQAEPRIFYEIEALKNELDECPSTAFWQSDVPSSDVFLTCDYKIMNCSSDGIFPATKTLIQTSPMESLNFDHLANTVDSNLQHSKLVTRFDDDMQNDPVSSTLSRCCCKYENYLAQEDCSTLCDAHPRIFHEIEDLKCQVDERCFLPLTAACWKSDAHSSGTFPDCDYMNKNWKDGLLPGIEMLLQSSQLKGFEFNVLTDSLDDIKQCNQQIPDSSIILRTSSPKDVLICSDLEREREFWLQDSSKDVINGGWHGSSNVVSNFESASSHANTGYSEFVDQILNASSCSKVIVNGDKQSCFFAVTNAGLEMVHIHDSYLDREPLDAVSTHSLDWYTEGIYRNRPKVFYSEDIKNQQQRILKHVHNNSDSPSCMPFGDEMHSVKGYLGESGALSCVLSWDAVEKKLPYETLKDLGMLSSGPLMYTHSDKVYGKEACELPYNEDRLSDAEDVRMWMDGCLY